MTLNLGRRAVDSTVYIPFPSYDSAGASVTMSGFLVTDIEIYKDGSVTQRSSDAGITLLDTDGIDFDAVTGLHGFSIDLSNNTDAGFYASGSFYWVVVSTVTIDGQIVTFIAAVFDIGAVEALVWDENIEAAHGTDATAGLLLRALGQKISNETRDANLLDQLKTVRAVVEHQRGSHTHQPIGNIFYVDPTNGATHASGARGGISDPYDDIQDCHDNGVTDSNHDLIILLSGAAAGATTHSTAATITLSKRYMFLRGPGRDFIITRSTNGDTITITGDGVEVSGFQLETNAAGVGNGISATSADFLRAHKLWVNDTQGHGIYLTDCDNAQITENSFHGTGVSGAGHGLVLDAGNGETNAHARIAGNHFHEVTGDCVKLDPTGSGTIVETEVFDNHFTNATGIGVNVVGAGASFTAIYDNTFGSIAGGNVVDSGTSTVQYNNEQWAKEATTQLILTDTGTTLEAHMTDIKGTTFAKDTHSLTNIEGYVDVIDDGTSGLVKIAADVALVLLDTAELQTDDIPTLIAGLNDPTAAAIATAVLTTSMVEDYAADGAAVTLLQGTYEIMQTLSEFAITGTTITVKKRDGSTTALTFTLNSASDPTSRTRAS